MQLSFEKNVDLVSVLRDSYTFIDMLSDIGGIESILLSTFALLLSVLNHNYFDNYMVQRLYKLSPAKAAGSDEGQPGDLESFKPSKMTNSCDFFVD